MRIHALSAIAALAAALALPLAANASSVWHQTDTEIGYAIAPEHAAGHKTRAQVQSELAAAKADKAQWYLANLNAAKPGWARQGTSRTREDALAELRAVTPAERARLAEIYTPG